MGRHLSRRHAAERITSAQPSLSEDVRGRQQRYLFAMSVRVACVIVCVVCWNSVRILAVTALAGGVLIPFAAVVFANGGRRRPPPLPAAVPAPAPRPAGPSTAVVLREAGAPAGPEPPPDRDRGAAGPSEAPLVGRVIRRSDAC